LSGLQQSALGNSKLEADSKPEAGNKPEVGKLVHSKPVRVRNSSTDNGNAFGALTNRRTQGW
jgi:hypothetical protein